ncbi:MAG: oligosaccharide repeat unit polymerase [Bacteroidales bacterium]|nr:oligosaccharide repeat unit polymerase [Bacteroidales bacterium]
MKKYIENIISNKLYIYVSLTTFVLLNISYAFDVSPKFYGTYLPFSFEFDIVKFVVIISLSSVITVLGGLIKSDFLKLIWYIVLIMQYYSSAVLFAYCLDISFGVVLQNVILLAILFFGDFIDFKISLPSISLKNNYKTFLIFSVILFVPFIYYYWQFISLADLFLNKDDIYKTRDLFRSINVPFLGYLISPLSRVIFPIMMVYAIRSRKYYLFIIAAMSIAYLFLCSATKSVLIGGILTAFFYYGNEWKDKFKLFSGLIITLLIVSFIASYFFQFKDITDAFVRRVFFVPPYFDNIYHSYFGSNYTYWGHSPFGMHLHNVDYMNGKGVSMFIGEDILHFDGLNANTGIITEGFLSFGYIGVAVHSIAFLGVIAYLKNLNLSPHYFGILFAYIFYLNSSLLSTLLVTHGLLFLLIVFTLFLRDSKDSFIN